MTMTTAVPTIGELLADPQHPGWGTPRWPEWLTEFRPDQKIAVARIVEEYDRGINMVLLDAPVGAGKTVIAEAVRRVMNPGHTSYCCTDHALQAQVERDFPYAVGLRGRDNYPTMNYPHLFDLPWNDPERVTCGDCDMDQGMCSFCEDPDFCSYRSQKAKAVIAPLSCTNTSYFLAECNHLGLGSELRGRGMLVLDEADTVEQALWSFEEISISPGLQASIGLDAPDRKTVPEAWERWFAYAIPIVKAKRDKTPRNTTRNARRRTSLSRLLSRLEKVAPEVSLGRWVYDYPDDYIKFKPIRVEAIARSLLWDHAHRWLCMSATLLGRDVFLDPLGWYDPASYIQLPSMFPAARRPIRVVPAADMGKKNREEAWPKMAKVIGRLMADHPDERILVHTVSYSLTRYLVEAVSSPRAMTYLRAKERTQVLEEFRNTHAAVLFAPSMERGVDLPYDACRVGVITQLAFPDLGDKQVKARRYSTGGKTWYMVEMIRKLAQSIGRHHRAIDDDSVTYILDKRFDRIHRQYKNIFPASVNEAIVTTGDWARRWLAD